MEGINKCININMKNLNNYILEKLVIDKNAESSFKTILSKLEEYDSPYLENTLHLKGECCIDVIYNKAKNWDILSIAPNGDKLEAEIIDNNEGDVVKTVSIDEKTFNKLFSKKDIEEIIKTLDES